MVYRRLRRYREEGRAAVESAILQRRALAHCGPVFLAGELGLVASTVGRVLRRHQVPPLSAIEPVTGTPVRRRHSGLRSQRHAPSEPLYVDSPLRRTSDRR